MSNARIITSNVTSSEQLQIIVAGHANNEPLVIWRISDGKRGRGNAWHYVDLEQLCHAIASSSYKVGTLMSAELTNSELDKLLCGVVTPAWTRLKNNASATTVMQSSADIIESLQSSYDSLSAATPTSVITTPAAVTPAAVTTVAPTSPESAGSSNQEGILNMALASIPDASIGREYVQRKIVGDITEFDVYDEALAQGRNVIVYGPAGSGKTMSVTAYASVKSMRYYNVSSNIGTEPSQLFGKWNPCADGSFRWQDGAVTDLVRHGGVLLINEVNFLPERVSTVLFSLLDSRREIQLLDKDGEVIKAHPDLLIVADYNPGYRGTRPLNEAFKDRFSMCLSFDYDPAIESKLISNKALLEIAKALRDVYARDEISKPISTRSLVAFQQNLNALGVDFAIMSYLNSFDDETEKQAVELIFTLHRDALVGKAASTTTVEGI